MYRLLRNFLFFLFALSSTPVIAQTTLEQVERLTQAFWNIEGEYEGRGEGGDLWMRTFVLDNSVEKNASGLVASGIVAARINVVRQKSCVGRFSGIGKYYDSTLRLRPINTESGKTCVITLIFDKSGKNATMTEEGCISLHGATCGFVGDITKKR